MQYVFLVKTGEWTPTERLPRVFTNMWHNACAVSIHQSGSRPGMGLLTATFHSTCQPCVSGSTKESFPIYFSSYEDISLYLCNLTGESHGFAPRSIRRFCSARGIRCRGELDDSSLDNVVSCLVRRVGHSYGRQTMHGLLRSHGYRVSQSRIAMSLRHATPIQHTCSMHQFLNPFLYQAHYYGDKLHLDQNEKCVMFGVTHVLAINGYSRKIVGFITIHKKNTILICDLLFRPLLLFTFG